MKVTKYILLSTTVLGLVNPLVVLADDSNASSTSSASNNSKIESKSSSEQKGTTQTNNAHLNQSLETGSWDGNNWELTDDGSLNFNNGFISEQPTQSRGMTAEQESKIKKINILGSWSNIRDEAGRNLFANFPNLETITGLDQHWEIVKLYDMSGMFSNNPKLKNVNLSEFQLDNYELNMNKLFMDDTSLEALNLTNSFHLSGSSQDMFKNDKNLNLLALGEGIIRFNGNENLPEIASTSIYTGKWQNVGNGTVDHPTGKNIWSSSELINNYRGSDDADTYVWQKNEAADVTVRYLDENGKDIINPEIKSGYVGDDYTTEQKAFDGYMFHDVKGETSGKLDSQPKTVTYTYYKDDGSNHTVNFYDMNGKKIANEISIDGRFEDNYDLTEQVNTTLKDLQKQGYKQVSNYGSIKGKFVQVHDGAGYILTKLPENAVGTVKVNYVDEQGQSISDSKILSGKLGSDYQTEKKLIKGYTFKEVQGKETGKITNKEQTVTYVYTKNPEKGADVTVKYVDENGKELAKSEVKSGNVGDKYTTEKKDIAGYTFKEVKGSTNGEFTDKAQTVTYIYTKNPEKGADVTVKYVDENGKEIAKSEVKSGNVGEKYTTEKKDVEGYTFKEVKGSVSGEFTDKAQTVTYIYTKNDDNVKPSEPSQPAKPDTPDHSGDTDKPTDNNSNSSEQPGNNSTVNDVVNNVVRSVLPKTAAAKVTLAGIVSVVSASLVGLIVWKRRK